MRKQGKWNKHIEVKDGIEYWKFDNGENREIPSKEDRKQIILSTHEILNHRGIEAVYYELKKKFYWPGI